MGLNTQYLLNGYCVLLLIATSIVFIFSIRNPKDRKVDFGLLIYLSFSSIYSLYTLIVNDLNRVNFVNSIYESLIIPAVYFTRYFKWNFLFIAHFVFLFLFLLNVTFNYYLIIYFSSLILFVLHHFYYEKKFDYLIHNLFLISVFVFSLLFDLFSEYQQFWISSHYKYNVFIFYCFFLYIFYIFIIFKYAKS